MRVGLQTWGTEGDIRPVAALAAGLATRGHEVTLAATGSPPPEYFSVAARCGFTLHVTAVPGLEDPATQDRLAAEWIAAGHPLRQAEMILAASVDPAVELMTAAARDLCETSDLVIGHFFVHPLHALSEKAGVPMVTVHLVHTSLPSAFIRPPGFPIARQSRASDRLESDAGDRQPRIP